MTSFTVSNTENMATHTYNIFETDSHNWVHNSTMFPRRVSLLQTYHIIDYDYDYGV